MRSDQKAKLRGVFLGRGRDPRLWLCQSCQYNVRTPGRKICGVCEKLGRSWRVFKKGGADGV
jgi:hypothetical protein